MRPSLILPLAALLASTSFAQTTTPTSKPASAPAAPKLPFTISKETTRITSPLRPDGTVDYLAALNQKYSQGVTPDNNGFVLWLQLTGTGDNVLSPKIKAELLQLAGAKELPPITPVWEDYAVYLKRTRNMDDPKPAWDEIDAMRRTPWSADQHQDLAAFLKLHEPQLTLVARAAQRPQWWTPRVTVNGSVMNSAFAPSMSSISYVADSLCARAMLRAGSGDLAGFLADVKTLRQLARHSANEATIIDRTRGASLEKQATSTIASLAASGVLTEPQTRQVTAALEALPPIPSVAEGLDLFERYSCLDGVQSLAVKDVYGIVSLGLLVDDDLRSLLPEDPQKITSTTGNIDRAAVDWDSILKQYNTIFDDTVKAARNPFMKQLQTASHDLDLRLKSSQTKFITGRLDLSQAPGESRAVYSDRITQFAFVLFKPNWLISEEIVRRSNQQTDMTRLLLAAAQYKARTNKWPATLADLVPAYIKELPQDIYSPDNAPLRYLLTPQGPRIYSIGPNARDDAGLHDANGKDDLAIGAQ